MTTFLPFCFARSTTPLTSAFWIFCFRFTIYMIVPIPLTMWALRKAASPPADPSTVRTETSLYDIGLFFCSSEPFLTRERLWLAVLCLLLKSRLGFFNPMPITWVLMLWLFRYRLFLIIGPEGTMSFLGEKEGLVLEGTFFFLLPMVRCIKEILIRHQLIEHIKSTTCKRVFDYLTYPRRCHFRSKFIRSNKHFQFLQDLHKRNIYFYIKRN